MPTDCLTGIRGDSNLNASKLFYARQNMSYGFPEKQQNRPRAGGGRFFFFIILAVGAFILLSNRPGLQNGGQQNGQKIPGPLDQFPEDDTQLTIDDLLENKNQNRQSSDDWNMGEVETTDSRSASGAAKPASNTSINLEPTSDPKNKTTRKGDWSTGEVDTDPKPKSDGFKFSNPSENQELPEKTTNGDWEMKEGKGSDNG